MFDYVLGNDALWCHFSVPPTISLTKVDNHDGLVLLPATGLQTMRNLDQIVVAYECRVYGHLCSSVHHMEIALRVAVECLVFCACIDRLRCRMTSSYKEYWRVAMIWGGYVALASQMLDNI